MGPIEPRESFHEEKSLQLESESRRRESGEAEEGSGAQRLRLGEGLDPMLPALRTSNGGSPQKLGMTGQQPARERR